MEFIKLSTLILFFFTESFFILRKYESIFHLFPLSFLAIFFILYYHLSKPSQIYLLDFSCLKPPHFCRAPISTYLEHAHLFEFLDKDSVKFMSKIIKTSGQCDETYVPPCLSYIPPRTSQIDSIDETHMVLYPVFKDLLSKTNLSPHEIDILIVNCSGFCPSPSLSAIIVNKFKLKEDIKSFNISGMGCSASALCIDMAYNLLKVHKNSNAVILSTEILSNGYYTGKNKPMMILNCLFRMGSAAILLTNKPQFKNTAKYKLNLSIRTQSSSNDKAYSSAMKEEDESGLTGVTFKQDLVQSAGEALSSHLLVLGSSVFPISKKLNFVFSVLYKRYINKSTEIRVPNFMHVIDHFCLPNPGKSLIKEIRKGLNLGKRETEAALMTLNRFGNQSSSSLWYELSYIESKEMVKLYDKVLLVGLGSGVKCTSLVFECNRVIFGEAKWSPWCDCIDDYPISSVNLEI